ncbi:MAG: restriction endonuclease subunit S [Paludibacteraceae bacterium]|nr:restriction endonuclease subunit S [Paludibacteraceae bacterium]
MESIEQMINRLCPDGVESYKLEEFSTQLSGMSAVSGKWKEVGNCQFIDYMNAYKNIRINVNDLPFATVKNRNNQTILKKGDVLFTSASETPDECALSAVIEDDILDGIFLDDHLFGIRIKEEWKDMLLPAYLKYIFRAPCFRKEVNKSVRGVTRFYISKKDFMKSSIPVPPMPIQVFIANFLDMLTTLEAELEAELDCRKRQYEYYRNKLLTFSQMGG